MSGTSTLNVIVVGAGLAGLACAADLAAAGAAVTVLEASDAVGGRMRTDRVNPGSRDSFLLDRGFQVFNTSYPQVQRRVDLRALQLSPFTPGMLLHTGAGRLRFTDPTRRPAGQGDLLRGRLSGPGGLAALAALSARDMLLPGGGAEKEGEHCKYTIDGALPVMLPPWPLSRPSRVEVPAALVPGARARAARAGTCAATTARPARSRGRWPPAPGPPARSWPTPSCAPILARRGRAGCPAALLTGGVTASHAWCDHGQATDEGEGIHDAAV